MTSIDQAMAFNGIAPHCWNSLTNVYRTNQVLGLQCENMRSRFFL